MDHQAAAAEVREFLALLDDATDNLPNVRGDDVRLIDEKVRAAAAVVELIAEAYDPTSVPYLRPAETAARWKWPHARKGAVRLLSMIENRERVATILGPQGPQLVATNLHPWVWDAAAKLWDGGSRRAAIQQAATAIDTQLQAKLNRYERSGKDLMAHAFNSSPPLDGEPRLRLKDFPEASPTYRSQLEGVRNFAIGCTQAIRNVVTHWPDEPEESDALEQLAALSVLARWIDRARVEHSLGE